MGLGQVVLVVANLVVMFLGLGLLILGVKTGLHGITGLACAIIIVSVFGCCECFIMYSVCMLILMMLCVLYLVSPATLQPVLAQQLEEWILASSMRTGSDLPCCPTLPLDRPSDLTSVLANKLMSFGNKIVCTGTTLVGLPSCEVAVNLYLNSHGRGIAIVTGLIALCAFGISVSQIRNKSRG